MLAVVLTHNAPGALRDCLAAVERQSRPPDAVLVVDNASVPPATIDGQLVATRVLRRADNDGPAGGWAAGLTEFLASGHQLAWLMDDDSLPEPHCLRALLEADAERSAPAFVFPSWVQPGGEVTHYPAWCGLLIDRRVVEAVGVPRVDLVWWVEDTEYLMWRIPRAGFRAHHAPGAVVHHNKGRGRPGNPPWKYYYETRNTIWYHLWIRGNRRRLPRKLGLLLARCLLREREERWRRLAMMARGAVDGVLGRLGRTVELS